MSSVLDEKASPRWARRKEARPSEIIDAALDIFVERGFAATRLEDVATRAGVSKGTVYLYFPNKEELFKAVVRQAIVPSIELAEEALRNHRGSSRELLATLINGWWQRVGATRVGGIPKLMICEARNFPELAQFYVEEVIQRAQRVFAGAIRRGISSGEFRETDVDGAVRLAMAPLLFVALWGHSFACCGAPDLEAEKLLAQHAELLGQGLLAGNAGPPKRRASRARRTTRAGKESTP